jgi:lysozyme family protein
MPYFVALACFDMAINSGPKRALALFQQAMGFEGDPLRYTGETDGKWGPKTMGAARTATRNEWAAACRYQMVRVMYYHRIADQPSEFNELKSWLSRVNKFNKKYLLNCSIS